MFKFRVLLQRFSVQGRFLKTLPDNSKVLDLGCGDCYRTRKCLSMRPDLQFYGVDIETHHGQDQTLKEIQLANLNRDALKWGNNFFDAIIFSHVIEHLDSTIPIAKEITRVLKKNGLLYIEAPCKKTVKLPSRKTFSKFGIPVGTINFYDDATHKKPYDPEGLEQFLLRCNLKKVECGIVRNPVRLALTPLMFLIGILSRDGTAVGSAILGTDRMGLLCNWKKVRRS